MRQSGKSWPTFNRKWSTTRKIIRFMMMNFLLLLGVSIPWRHSLEQPYHTVEVLTDHSNLPSFMSTHKLTRREVRWALDLSEFDFRLVYRKRTLNTTYGRSRRPDYQKDTEWEDSMTDITSALQKMLFPIINSGNPSTYVTHRGED